jgi:predicted unusual protein kinase regulating ubiquinone biosynthesis (AarF/ABC1/UbiB family)
MLGEHAIAFGSYGDVWKGLLRGEDVCVKVVRIKVSEIAELLKVAA